MWRSETRTLFKEWLFFGSCCLSFKPLCYFSFCCLNKNLSENSRMSTELFGMERRDLNQYAALWERKLRGWLQLFFPLEPLKHFVLGLSKEWFSYNISICFSALWKQKELWGPWQTVPCTILNSALSIQGCEHCFPIPEGICHHEETTKSSDSPEQLFPKYFPLGCDMGRWTRQKQMSPDLEEGFDLGGQPHGVVLHAGWSWNSPYWNLDSAMHLLCDLG